jgi:hypothetical protein
MFGQINPALQALSEEIREFVGSVYPYECQQRELWKRSTFKPISDKGLHQVEDLRRCAQWSVSGHRFVTGDRGGHHFRTGIIGPRKSGKSTLLKIYWEQAVLDITACGNWKQFFILEFDMKWFVPFANSYADFYKKFLGLICDDISAQRFAYTQYMTEIRGYFEALISNPVLLQIPDRSLAEQLSLIGNEIKEAWEDAQSIDWWITLVFSLALTMPIIFGFAKTLFIIDNIEAANLTVFPAGNFSAGAPCEIGEHLKYLLLRSDYIFACEKIDRLYRFLSPIDQDGVDLAAGTEFLPTFDVGDMTEEFDPPLYLELSEDPEAFVLKGEYCEGIPMYLSLWYDLNNCVDEVEKQGADSEGGATALSFAVAQAQVVMDILFAPDPNRRTRVLSVRRSSPRERRELQAEEDQKFADLDRASGYPSASASE